LPIDAIVDAVGPQVFRAYAAQQKEADKRRRERPPIIALKKAAARLADKLSTYERAARTPGERAAFDSFVLAARELRSAHLALNQKI